MINFTDVTKQYPDGTVAVSKLNLEVPTGKITVFVGPSGCGKTTSLRMINRMIEPTSGTIAIDGVDITSSHPATLRRGIGYVIQNVGLFPHRTIVDNIATVPILDGVGRRQARARATELLERVGLSAAVAQRYPSQLSGGQQQRVGVARALAADPPVLLMDEPFSAVDPVVRGQLQDEMLRLQDELGKTVVFVTHDIDEALRLGDLVVVFAPGGRVAQASDPATLLERPADDFVSDFVGRDRGYRALSFSDAAQITAGPVATLPADEVMTAIDTGARLEVPAQQWVLMVDPDRRPQGWFDTTRIGTGQAPRLGDILPGGSLIHPGGSLRAALDSVLSSPSGHGVVVDESGQLIGTVAMDAVLQAVEAAHGRSIGAGATQ